MSELKSGILGVIAASLGYFSSAESTLSDKARKHISKKSHDQKIELEELQNLLAQLIEKQKNLEDEQLKIETEYSRINLIKNKLSYYSNEYRNEIFTLQNQLFELETQINNVLSTTPRPDIQNNIAQFNSPLALLQKSSSHKNYQSRVSVSQQELKKAEEKIIQLEQDLRSAHKDLESINFQLSNSISEKRQLLLNNKKIFDEKFKNFSIRQPKKSFHLN